MGETRKVEIQRLKASVKIITLDGIAIARFLALFGQNDVDGVGLVSDGVEICRTFNDKGEFIESSGVKAFVQIKRQYLLVFVGGAVAPIYRIIAEAAFFAAF